MAIFNPSPDPSKEALQHGMALETTYSRIQCNYCGEIVPGFIPLRLHLGGVLSTISACPNVPEDVREYFRTSVLGPKEHPLGSSSSGGSQNNLVLLAESGNDLMSVSSTNRPPNGIIDQSNGLRATSNAGIRSCSHSASVGTSDVPALNEFKRNIGRFFFESAIDFSLVKSPKFKNMIRFPNKDGAVYSLPTVDELHGWIFDEEFEDILNYVNKIRLSWASTGCSILLDGWTDSRGRDLMNVLVDSPAGPVYLKTADISPSEGDDALLVLLESVIAEVGVKNIVQIVAHTPSASFNAVRQNLSHKHKSLFWTVSATRCLSMILEKFADESDLIKPTLEKAKIITRFIYGNSEARQLLKRHITSRDLVIPSKIKTASDFLTIENFVSEQTNLKKMCTSSEWLGSSWGSSHEGKMVARWISDDLFWRDVETVVQVSIPAVTAMSLINEGDDSGLGFIYEMMDQIKETILEELEEESPEVTKYWKMIDEIWNEILHCPIHAAAYYLNPKFFYDDNFQLDSEVAAGLLLSIVGMVDGCSVQDKVSLQLYWYKYRVEVFQQGITCKDSLPPASWWACYGCYCPELQRFAFRLQSQKCIGADSYELPKELAEKLVPDTPGNTIELQKQFNLTFLHYNLKLQDFKHGPKCNIRADQIDPTDDWVIDKAPQGLRLRIGP